jgi:anti-sigma regulatory factor (Ser/Thr protein kinase)
VGEAEREARRLHSGPFPPEASAVVSTRRALLSFLGDEVPEDRAAIAALLVSEVATNAMVHAGTPFTICAAVTPDNVRVEPEFRSWVAGLGAVNGV